MKNLSTWLLAMFMAMFVVLRVIITITNQQGETFAGITIENLTIEIVLIFIAVFCLLFVIKRKLLGAILYLISYGWYFGVDVYSIITNVIVNESSLGMEGILRLLISGIGVLLPLMVLMDTLADKSRKVHPVDKNTDWFYKNKQFDRKFDERADRNEYKF